MISGQATTVLPNTVAPFDNNLAKPAGQANPDAGASTIRPVEEPPKSERNQRRNRSLEAGLSSDEPSTQNLSDSSARDAGDEGLSADELAQLQKLAARQRAVISHEQAHANVGGDLAGAPSYQYETGPDGRRYVVGGEVSISLRASSGDPATTASNARRVQRAALAPLEPSPQDRLVAAQAAQIEQQALRELAQQSQAAGQYELAGSRAEAEVERLRDDKQRLQQELQELRLQQRASQAEIYRKSLELTQTLVGLDNISANKVPGQLIDSVS